MKRILIIIFFLTSLSLNAQETYFKQSIQTVTASAVYQRVSLGAGIKTVVVYNISDSTCWAGFYSGGKDTANAFPVLSGITQYFYSKNTDTAYIKGSGTIYIGVIYGGGVSVGGGVSNKIPYLNKNNTFTQNIVALTFRATGTDGVYGSTNGYMGFTNRTVWRSPVNGGITFSNSSETSFTDFKVGGGNYDAGLYHGTVDVDVTALYLRSPNGTKYYITVNDAGVISASTSAP